jgi:hypothetical protein
MPDEAAQRDTHAPPLTIALAWMAVGFTFLAVVTLVVVGL